MKLTLFSFSLPLIIGYVLFIGISGKLWPFSKPIEERQRPAWMLGLWAGFSVAIVLTLMLNMAYQPSTASLTAIIFPTVALLATLLVPGFIAWYMYKRRIERELTADHDLSEVTIITQEVIEVNDTTQNFDEALNLIEPGTVRDNGILTDEYTIDDATDFVDGELEEPDVEIAEPEDINIVAVTSTETYNIAFWEARNRVINTLPSPTAVAESDSIEASTKTDTSTVTDSSEQIELKERMTAQWIHPEQQLTLDLGDLPEKKPATVLATDSESNEEPSEALPLAVSEALEAETQLDFSFDEPMTTVFDEVALAERVEEEVAAQLELQSEQHKQAVNEIQDRLLNEQQQREHVETHLRITRKALVTLESKSRADETANLNQRIELEDQLAESIRQIAIADARADREAQARSALELELKESRRAVLEAKQATSKNLAARAKALKTANKAIAFARQTIDARSKVETNARKLKETIESQQATIGSLINSLESEQAQALEEKSFLAKQLIKKEKSSNEAVVTTEEASESLASKLVQKVARSSASRA